MYQEKDLAFKANEMISSLNSRLAREFRRFRTQDKSKSAFWENTDIEVLVGTLIEGESEEAAALKQLGLFGDWVIVNPKTSSDEIRAGRFRVVELKGNILPEVFLGNDGVVHRAYVEYFLRSEGGLVLKRSGMFRDENEDAWRYPSISRLPFSQQGDYSDFNNREYKSLNPNDYEYLGSILASLKRGDLKRIR